MWRTTRLIVLGLLMVGLGVVARERGLGALFGGMQLGAPPTAVATDWKTEEEWLVGDIARDIAEMAYFARHRRAPEAGELRVRAETTGKPGIDPIAVSVTARGADPWSSDLPIAFVWGPEEYVAFARTAFSGVLPPAGEAPAPVPGVLDALTDPLALVIEDQNRRVSTALASRPLDPALHEQAALVLAALAWREAAGISHDVRPVLSRMAAHLAVARAIDPGAPRTAGKVAHAALLTLAGRGADAEAAIADLPAAGPGERAWQRALSLAVTDDRRILPRPSEASLLERMAHLEAARASEHGTFLQVMTELAHGEDDFRELTRVVLGGTITVQVGNVLVDSGLRIEERDLDAVHARAVGRALAPGERAAALAATHQRLVAAPAPRVIGWGTWASYFRRHILHQMTAQEVHARKRLGLPQRADEIGRAFDAVYGGLPQYSLLLDRRETHGGRRPSRFDESITETIERPEQLAAFQFYAVHDLAVKEVIRRGPANRHAFFDPPLPRGTTFDYAMRQLGYPIDKSPAGTEAHLAISPRDPAVLAAYLRTRPKGTPADTLEAALGPRGEYDPTLLRLLAEVLDADRTAVERALVRLCEAVPTECNELGHFRIVEGRPEEAAPAMQMSYEADPDRVAASHTGAWLARHYFDHGRQSEAVRIADDAASTGSWAGLHVRASIYERQGRFAESEAQRLAVRERYADDATTDPPGENDHDDLIAFYHRMANERGDGAYAEKLKALAADVFPSGVERLDPAGLDWKDVSDGVALLRVPADMQRAGFQRGDVIVGVDGWRVRSVRQLEVARWFGDTSPLTFHVWRHPGFREIKLHAMGRMLDAEMRTNKPGQPSRRF